MAYVIIQHLSPKHKSIMASLLSKSTKMPVNGSLNKASPLGLTLNEIITNALKYAFPMKREGKLVIRIKKMDDGTVEAIIMDNGIGMPKDLDWKNADTLGLRLVRTLVENQLKGSIHLENKNGTKFTIKFNIES